MLLAGLYVQYEPNFASIILQAWMRQFADEVGAVTPLVHFGEVRSWCQLSGTFFMYKLQGQKTFFRAQESIHILKEAT